MTLRQAAVGVGLHWQERDALSSVPCFVFCYSNLNYSSRWQLFSFLKKKSFCWTVTGELFILCISIFSLHFWLFFFFAWLGLNVGNHLKSLLRHTCFVFILPFQDLLKSVNKERLSKITCKTLKLFDKLSGFCFIFVKRWSFQHWSDRRIFNRAPQKLEFNFQGYRNKHAQY